VKSTIFMRSNPLYNVNLPFADAELLPSFYSVGEFMKMFFRFFAIAQVRTLPTLLPLPYFKKHVRSPDPGLLKFSLLDWELGNFHPS
jgi:hypothetical protein